VKEDEMGRTCVGRRGIYVAFWWESQKERDHYENLDIRGRKTLKWKHS
jgi:hypothetical protein